MYLHGWKYSQGSYKTKVYVHEVDEILHLHTTAGDIDTTTNHPFYVIGRGWVAAGDINEGDEAVLVHNYNRKPRSPKSNVDSVDLQDGKITYTKMSPDNGQQYSVTYN